MEMTPLNKDVEAAEENIDDPQVEFLPKEKLKKDDLFSSPEIQFSGMSKEELVKFENDPFYKKLRMFLFIAFWVIWIGLLAAVIIIIVVSPKCPHRPVQQFWEKDATYKIEVKSYYGSGAAVFGNIKGIEEKLDYLKSLNVRNILLSSLAKTDANGFVEDFESVDPKYGTLEDLQQLLKKARKQEMRVLMELDVSYTSVNHSWFVDDNTRYKNYISSNSAHNTWYSRDGQVAWKLKNTRYYYSSLQNGQPSLDFGKQEVIDIILKSMRFWLDQGLSGFCLQNTAFIFGSRSNYSSMPSKSSVNTIGDPLKNWYAYDRSAQLFQPESLKFVIQLRSLLNEVQKATDKPRALLVDAGNLGFAPTIEKIFQYYGNETNEGAHVILNQQLAAGKNIVQVVNMTSSAARAFRISTSYLTAGCYFKRENVSALVGSALLLPGSPFLYYGQELGMQTFTSDYSTSPLSSLSGSAQQSNYDNDNVDAYQSIPMQWDDESANGGILSDSKKSLSWFSFSSARKTDLSANNYRKLSSSGHPSSSLTFLTKLLKLRTTKESLLFGELMIDDSTSEVENLLIFSRQAKGFSSFVVALNLDINRGYTRDLTFAGGRDANAVPLKGTVQFIQAKGDSAHKEDSEVVLDKVYLPKGPSLLVISY